MRKKKIRFRVVRVNENGQRFSFVIKKPGLQLCYEKGTVVKGIKNTPGVCVFTTKPLAEKFLRGFYSEATYFGWMSLIIKVRPIGQRRKPRFLYDLHFDSETQRFLNALQNKSYAKLFLAPTTANKWLIPRGTEFYSAVEVLT